MKFYVYYVVMYGSATRQVCFEYARVVLKQYSPWDHPKKPASALSQHPLERYITKTPCISCCVIILHVKATRWLHLICEQLDIQRNSYSAGVDGGPGAYSIY